MQHTTTLKLPKVVMMALSHSFRFGLAAASLASNFSMILSLCESKILSRSIELSESDAVIGMVAVLVDWRVDMLVLELSLMLELLRDVADGMTLPSTSAAVVGTCSRSNAGGISTKDSRKAEIILSVTPNALSASCRDVQALLACIWVGFLFD